jgi:hypothetical protein
MYLAFRRKLVVLRNIIDNIYSLITSWILLSSNGLKHSEQIERRN